MGVYEVIFYVVLWCLIFVAIIHCWRISSRGGHNHAAAATTNQTAAATSGTLPQEQATATDGIDPALLRSKVIETIFPGQTVRATADLLLLMRVILFLLLLRSFLNKTGVLLRIVLTHS